MQWMEISLRKVIKENGSSELTIKRKYVPVPVDQSFISLGTWIAFKNVSGELEILKWETERLKIHSNCSQTFSNFNT